MILAAFTYENLLLIFQSSFRLEIAVSVEEDLKIFKRSWRLSTYKMKSFYLLVQGEILEVLMTIEETAIQ